ncbi:hypothetical protein DUI87_11226 [Hirundo rustica rustica]|uniref:Uncharacterized protein n=1 Tax=Hirundo rustica rustica TaxID=333673 RepID=A0A3M0KHK9_HIRRU|nr:hypothetical protein DUI87_11226 [Hirundo rustica rustica]
MNSVGAVDGHLFHDSGPDFTGNRSEHSQPAYAVTTDPVPCKAATSYSSLLVQAKMNGMEWNGMEWNGMEWNGMEWNGMEWNGTEWNGDAHTK